MKMRVYTPAKINLTLEILKKRNDGYHEIKSLMQSINIYDEIIIKTNNCAEINIFCNNKNIPFNEDNIAFKAAKLFLEYTNNENFGVNIHIEKNIPISAGLAGGSTNAAGVLLALNKILNTKLNANDLCKLATKIGADVPFCIFGGTKLAQGIGEILTHVSSNAVYYIVLVKPNLNICTKQAYSKIDNLNNFVNTNATDKMLKSIYNNDLNGMSSFLYNDFERVSNLTSINKIKNIMEDNGALGSCMSGSGPSVYGIFKYKTSAKICITKLKQYYENVFLCLPINSGCFIKESILED